MKLTKQGAYKYEGVTTLVDTESLFQHEGFLMWQKGAWNLLLRVRGIDRRSTGRSTYHYDLQFSAHELAMLVETALTEASKDGAIHAHAKAMGAFIREVLDFKNDPQRA